MTYAPAIAAPGPAAGLDLTPGGDSLVVTLPTLRQLGIVDLTTPSPTWHLVGLALDTTLYRRPYGVRVAVNSHALIALTTPQYTPGGQIGQVLEYNLQTGAQRLRREAGSIDLLSTAQPMTVSGDRSRILLLLDTDV